MIKVYNGYAGVGGNRQNWKNVDVVAVEKNKKIAMIYQDRFPNDEIIIGDSRDVFLKRHKEFDFAWFSPPCQRNSKARYLASKYGDYPPKYPDLRLYEEVIFLRKYFNGFWVVENVKPFYEPLILPTIISKHAFWANFPIAFGVRLSKKYHFNTINELQQDKGIDLSKYDFKGLNKLQVIRNAVHPRLGEWILDCALQKTQRTVGDFSSNKGMELTLNPIPSQTDNKNNGSGTKPSTRGI